MHLARHSAKGEGEEDKVRGGEDSIRDSNIGRDVAAGGVWGVLHPPNGDVSKKSGKILTIR